MNPSALFALPLLAVVLWLLSRRRPQVSPSTVIRPVGAASEWVQTVGPVAAEPTGSEATGTAGPERLLEVTPGRHRQQRLFALSRQFTASPEQRVEALRQLDLCGDRAALPLLQRGLRDPHPEVVRAAAAAIARFRGRTAAGGLGGSPQGLLRLPRNARPRA